MATYFTSDHHLGHDNILKYCRMTRPYRDVRAMAEDYADQWDARISADDVVWVLGDISLKFPPVEDFMSARPGRKHLVVGNHDRCFDMQSELLDAYLVIGFCSVARQQVIDVQGMRCVLNHFPYPSPPHLRGADPRLAEQLARFDALAARPGAAGEDALLHGHVHQHWRCRIREGLQPEINVSLDAWGGSPVHEDVVVALVREATDRGGPGQMDVWGAWGPLVPEVSG